MGTKSIEVNPDQGTLITVSQLPDEQASERIIIDEHFPDVLPQPPTNGSNDGAESDGSPLDPFRTHKAELRALDHMDRAAQLGTTAHNIGKALTAMSFEDNTESKEGKRLQGIFYNSEKGISRERIYAKGELAKSLGIEVSIDWNQKTGLSEFELADESQQSQLDAAWTAFNHTYGNTNAENAVRRQVRREEIQAEIATASLPDLQAA